MLERAQSEGVGLAAAKGTCSKKSFAELFFQKSDRLLSST